MKLCREETVNSVRKCLVLLEIQVTALEGVVIAHNILL